MANEPKKNEKKPAETKTYTAKLTVYRNDGSRVKPGQTVRADELPPESIASLIERKALSDPDAPIPPSQASAQLAHETLAQIAIAGGVITAKDGVFKFGDREIAGDVAAATTIDELREAIVAKLKA